MSLFSVRATPHRINPSFRDPAFAECCALAIMAKAPHPGRSKTRLSPPLTPTEAAELSRCFIRDTAESFIEAAKLWASIRGVAVFTPTDAVNEFDTLLPGEFWTIPQRGESFGERLGLAVDDLLAAGFGSVCLIDSDSPTVPVVWLVEAAERLAAPGDRAVLGPSLDGGYYLIGVKQSHPQLFADITWSTSAVMGETIRQARLLNLSVDVLGTWYDVDDAPSLDALCEELLEARPSTAIGAKANHSRRFLEEIIAQEGPARVRRTSGPFGWAHP